MPISTHRLMAQEARRALSAESGLTLRQLDHLGSSGLLGPEYVACGTGNRRPWDELCVRTIAAARVAQYLRIFTPAMTFRDAVGLRDRLLAGESVEGYGIVFRVTL